MKKIFYYQFYILTICLATTFFTQQTAQANIELYDGKLILSGFVKEVWLLQSQHD